jgi:hypothetical protein
MWRLKTMDAIKNLLNGFGRTLLVKWLVRGIGYGLTALSAKLAIDKPSDSVTGELAQWGATALIAGITMGIDFLQHRADKKAEAKAAMTGQTKAETQAEAKRDALS